MSWKLCYVERQHERGFGVWWQLNDLGWHWDHGFGLNPIDRKIADHSFELHIALYWSVRFLWGRHQPIIEESE
jgi:hypothetical protein